MTGEDRMLAACRLQSVDATPVWFMRQAGRCLAEYRQLRERYDILEIAKTPELCAQVTTMPVDVFGVDAAVMYADIMLPLDGMGVPFRIEPEIGPIIERPIRTAEDVSRLRIIEAEQRSEEHTSELQSLTNLVCRLLLEKKKKQTTKKHKEEI